MKNVFRLTAILLICVLLLVGCNNQAFVFNADAVSKIHLTNGTVTTTLEDANTVQSIVSLLNTASLEPDQTPAESLPMEQYRLTLVDSNDQAVESIVVFNDTLVQVKDTLYSGDLQAVNLLFSSYFTATSLEAFSELFTIEATNVEEIAMHDLSAKTYKIITDSQDIDTVISTMKATNLVQEKAEGTATEKFRIYVRYQGEKEYRLPLTVLISENNLNILEYDGRFCTSSSTDWKTLFTSMNYNVMP